MVFDLGRSFFLMATTTTSRPLERAASSTSSGNLPLPAIRPIRWSVLSTIVKVFAGPKPWWRRLKPTRSKQRHGRWPEGQLYPNGSPEPLTRTAEGQLYLNCRRPGLPEQRRPARPERMALPVTSHSYLITPRSDDSMNCISPSTSSPCAPSERSFSSLATCSSSRPAEP